MSTRHKLAHSGGDVVLSPAQLEEFLELAAWQFDLAANDLLPAALPSERQRLLKRILDIAVAIPVLIVAAPVMGAIALAIRLEFRGPVLFRQRRRGLNGEPFMILKFRTMTVCEDGDRIEQASRNDRRVTPLGRYLRMLSLDELPQLLNVLKGEMSLVGPRPHALAHDEFYGNQISYYALRQRVKPGITGWAQVHGCRGETVTLQSMRDRVDFDLWYARHASVFLDIAILFRTAFEVLRRRNAY